MIARIFDVTVILFSCFVRQTISLQCLKCDDVALPLMCEYVYNCNNDEVCSIEEYRNENGHIRYNLGCKLQKSCSSTNITTLQTKSLHGGTVDRVCQECCHNDLCNAAGCGSKGFPTHSGPICFSCDNVLDPSTCNRITGCDDDELCFIKEDERFNIQIYTSGCHKKFACQNIVNTQIFGRKKKSSQNHKKRTDLCVKCCEGDLCNYNCDGRKVEVTPTTSMTTSTSTMSSSETTTVTMTSPTTTIITSTTTESCKGKFFQGRCYTISTEKTNWTDAQAHCRKEGGYLVEITSSDINNVVKQLISGSGHTSDSFWIGATDKQKENEFRWATSNTRLTFTYWYPGDPDGGSSQNCLTTYHSQMGWIDAPCDNNYYYVCEK